MTTTQKTEKKILDFIRARRLVSRGDRVIVAVSGGADSVTLLHILHKVRDELGCELHVAHLDHRLRGDASHQDAQFVAGLAQKLGLPSTIEARAVRTYREENRLSTEEAAREVRYKFLSEVAEKIGASSVAVAHTLSDHVETVTLHLLRGTGLTGLVGLKDKSILRYKRVGPLTLIRPLLCLKRAEVEEYCRELTLEFRTDATNESLSFTRNRIRHTLLPGLRKDFNPRIDDALDKLAKIAADDVDFIQTETSKVASGVVRLDGNTVAIDRKGFASLHPALKRALLRQVLSSVLGSPKDIEAVHIEAMLDVAEGETGRSIDLLDGVAFVSGYQDLTLGRNAFEDIPLPEIKGERSLNIPGVTEISGWRVKATILENGTGLLTAGASDEYTGLFDLDAVGDELKVRARRAGDCLVPLGMESQKSVKDFFIDTKVPRAWRSRIPLVVNPCQVVWVVGHRLDDRVKVTPSSRRILRLEFTKTGC
ncbi:tRNA(Ile)-lysidine synthetase [Dehalogenimonas formicexedens]|uniref:tRNA(Ile)-lysidine synthase n=1 Tax=Dehalogenimonas formicexedens TaxID=1839801 RepID=A0A1P8FAD1_9CHLR|nr:tRNA lysidine(34) synthetase TilS [Dehalogenimonas formicexedens]APV45419.1 tRNA(Ile)-lysidine synthetase [Dehalogenimonas formicexedens]